jgi:hypothetical protein
MRLLSIKGLSCSTRNAAMNLAGPFKGNDILGSSSDPNYEETIFLSLSFWMGEG